MRHNTNYAARLRELDRVEQRIKLKKKVEDKERELGLRKTRRKTEWSKIMMLLIYAICLEIVIYAEIVMWVHYDLSALYALIGVPAAMFGVFWAYAAKSRAQNTKGGITYDLAMMQANNETATENPGQDEPTDAENGAG